MNALALPLLRKYAKADRLFAWIHYSDPHAPYILPQGETDPFVGDALFQGPGDRPIPNRLVAKGYTLEGHTDLTQRGFVDHRPILSGVLAAHRDHLSGHEGGVLAGEEGDHVGHLPYLGAPAEDLAPTRSFANTGAKSAAAKPEKPGPIGLAIGKPVRRSLVARLFSKSS